jgi:hypothetical protein
METAALGVKEDDDGEETGGTEVANVATGVSLVCGVAFEVSCMDAGGVAVVEFEFSVICSNFAAVSVAG